MLNPDWAWFPVPFLRIIMTSLKMIGRGRLVSPVATPRRVGVRWDVPLPIRSPWDESPRREDPGPGWGLVFARMGGGMGAGMGEALAHLAAEQKGAPRALHSGWSVRTAALGVAIRCPCQDLLSQ